MAVPDLAKLDANQCIQGAYDTVKGRLRVDAELTASIIAPPGLEVSISAVDDNIAIRNSDNTDELEINPDGSINIGNFPVTQAVTQSTSPWVISGTVTANQGGTWNINNISGTISLPTGASTATKQDTGNTSLASIDGKLVDNYGSATLALRTAAQVGNASGVADFNSGATGAQTLRVASNLYDGAANALTSTSFNSKQSLNIRSNDGFSTGSSTTPAINNVSSTVLAANTNRRYAYVFNQTGGVVYLKLGTTAVIGEGIRLVNNSMYEILTSNLWTGTITAIKSGAGSVNLDVFEGT